MYLYMINHLKDQHNQKTFLFSSIGSSQPSPNTSQTAKFLSPTSCNCGSSMRKVQKCTFKERWNDLQCGRVWIRKQIHASNQEGLKQTSAAEHSGQPCFWVPTGGAVLTQTCSSFTCQSLPNFTYYVQEHSWGKRQVSDGTWQVLPWWLFALTSVPFHR